MSTVDCSRYQGTLTAAELQGWKAAGYTRVILKVGGGDSGRYEDSKWATNYPTVLAVGLALEGYWFNGTTDPAGDAAFVNSIIPAGIRVWADVESEGSMPHWNDDQADTFERAVIAAGHPSGTYMSSSVTFGSWPKCSRRPLWVAAYGGSSVPPVGSWGAPVLWQYTSTGHLPGYSGYLDLDQDLPGLASTTATPLTGGFLMALTDAEQAEVLNSVRNIYSGLYAGGPALEDGHLPLERSIAQIHGVLTQQIDRAGVKNTQIQELADCKTLLLSVTAQVAALQHAIATIATGQGADPAAIQAAAKAGADEALANLKLEAVPAAPAS